MSTPLLLLLLLALLAMTHVAQGSVCKRDYCSRIRCLTLTRRNCPHTIVSKGGFCGCCDACIRILRTGESCRMLLARGPQPSIRCGHGLFCSSRTNKCQARERSPRSCSFMTIGRHMPWNMCGRGFFCNRWTGRCEPIRK